MTVKPILQWADFKGNWEDFQRLCADLVEDHGYLVELRSPGGGDQGRDIDAFEVVELFPVQKREIAFWVECKSRLAEKRTTVPVGEISKCILYAQTEGVPALVFMTNYKLSNEAKDQILRYSQMKNINLGVSYIEEELIARLILERPAIYRRYFRGTPPASPPASPAWVECILRGPSVPGPNRPAMLIAINHSLRSTQLSILHGDRCVGQIAVSAFSRTEFEVPFCILDGHGALATLTVLPAVEEVLVTLERRLTPDPFERPKRYFDPRRLVDKLRGRLDQGLNSYVIGSGGVGKTALASQATRSVDRQIIRIDASRVDTTTRFADLFFAAFSTPAGELRPGNVIDPCHAPDPLGVGSWSRSGVSEGRARPDLEREAELALVFANANLLAAKPILIVDNVHGLHDADIGVLQRLQLQRPAHAIVFVARPSEFRSQSVERLFFGDSDEAAYLRLDRATVSEALAEASSSLAANEATRAFFDQFKASGNFQSFTLLVEALVARSILVRAPDEPQRFVLSTDVENLSLSDYADIVRALLEAISFDGDFSIATSVLELASTWGKAFPANLIIYALGSEGEHCINMLIGAGLLVDCDDAYLDLEFDHDLTQELALRALPAFRAKRLHATIVSFLEALGADHPLNATTRRVHHLELSGSGGDAALQLNAYLLSRHSQIPRPEALALSLHCLNLMDRFGVRLSSIPAQADAADVELLTRIIELGYRCHGPNWGDDFLRRFELLAYSQGRPEVAGRNDYFWARHLLYRHLPSAAHERARKAVLELSRDEGDPYLVTSINRLGNVEKNLALFLASARTHRRAAKLARAHRNLLQLAQTYREFGATLLEAGRLSGATRWWRISVRYAEASGDADEIVQQKGNLAYARALGRERGESLGLAFKECDRLAQHFGLFGQQAKNMVNWANWLFHEMDQAEAGFAKISEAIKFAEVLDYEYVEVIAKFSYVTFAQCGSGIYRTDYEAFLSAFIDQKLVQTGRINTMADNRFLSLVKFFLKYRPNTLKASVFASRNAALKRFIDALAADDLAATESDNAYFRPNGAWALYY